MNYPGDLKYTRDHEWIKVTGDGTATVGITDFAQSELGDIVYVELNEEGSAISQGDIFGTVEAVKTVSDLLAPVDGEILEVNGLLDEEPEAVNEDPYGKGWMIRIKLIDPDQVKSLMSDEEYRKIIL